MGLRAEVALLLRVLARAEAHLASHPLRRLYKEAQEQLEATSLRATWREELLRLASKELRRLASAPSVDRSALRTRADRIDRRLQEDAPPEGWSPIGIPGEEWRSDPG